MRNYFEQLGISSDDVHARIGFLVGRGQFHREAAIRTSRDGLYRQSGRDDDNWRRVAQLGAAGSCFARAAALAMIAGGDAAGYVKQAASDYGDASLPFGLFLQILNTPEDQIASLLFNSSAGDWMSQIDAAIDKVSSDPEVPGGGDRLAENLVTQNQQLYLCFALVNSPVAAREYRSSLHRVIENLRRHPNVPHGPQGQPLQVQLDIVGPAFEMAQRDGVSEVPALALNALRRLANHYRETIEAARRNTYLWTKAWSPIDCLDLELVIAAVCLGRSSRNSDFLKTLGYDEIMSIPFQVAFEVLQNTSEGTYRSP